MSLSTSPQAAAPARTAGAHARALLVLGLPLIGSNLAQILIHLTDALMLGWYDVTALAAATLAQSFWFIVFLLGAGYAWAVAPMAAEAAEAGDAVQVRRVTRMGLWLSVLFAAAALPALWWSGPLFLVLGQDPRIAEAAQAYLRIAGWGMVPALLVMTLRSFLSALELTRIILWVTLGAAALNVALNWVLIFGHLGAPEMGIRGAAAASLSLQVVSFGALVVYVSRRVPDYDLFSRLWRADGAILRRVLRLGLPIGITNVAEAGLFSASAVMMGWLGEVPLAAHGIALQVASVMFMIHLGLSQAATVRAGRAFGRRDEAGLRRGGAVAMALSGAVALVTVVIFLTVPEPLVAAFVDPADPRRDAILAAGVTLLAIAALFQFVDAAQVMVLGLLRGVQDTTVPMIIAAIAYWALGLPAGWALGFALGLGGPGVWLGMVVGLGAAGLLLSARFWFGSVRIAGRQASAGGDAGRGTGGRPCGDRTPSGSSRPRGSGPGPAGPRRRPAPRP